MRRVRTLASGISRGTEALVFAGRVPPSQYAAMRAPLMGGALPVPGEIRLQRRRPRPTTATRVFVLHPHQDRLPRPRRDVHPGARRGADAARRARRQHGDRAEHRLGCRPARRRTHPRDRRRRGRPADRLAARAHPGRRGHAGRHRAGARPARRAAWAAGSPPPDDAPAEQDLVVHASASEAGLAPRARPRRLRGAHRRGKLVRRPRARACRSARRSMRAACG